MGELAVMFDMPRTATVMASTDVVAVSLSREDLLSAVGSERHEKMKVVARAEFLRAIPILSHLTSTQMVVLCERLRCDTFLRGAALCLESQPAERLFVIESGDVTLTEGEAKLDTLQAGQALGMLGMYFGGHYGCKAVARTETVKTLSCSYAEILSIVAIGERPALERTMRQSMALYLLTHVPALADTSKSSLKGVMTHLQETKHTAGDVIWEKGSIVNDVVIVQQGQLVELDDDANPLPATRPAGHRWGADGGTVGRLYGHECLEERTTTSRHTPARAHRTLRCDTDTHLLRVPVEALAPFVAASAQQ